MVSAGKALITSGFPCAGLAYLHNARPVVVHRDIKLVGQTAAR